MKWIYIFILTWCFCTCLKAQTVVVYPATNSAKISDKYIVSVSGHSSPVYKIIAGPGPSNEYGHESGHIANYTVWSFNGTVSVTVTKLGSSATSAIIRPASLGIGTLTATVAGGNSSVTFNLSHRAKFSAEFSDDPSLTNVALLFADSLESTTPDTTASTTFMATDSASLRGSLSGKTTVCFRPGYYPAMGQWVPPSNITQVYFFGGAYFCGFIDRLSGSSLLINGRGIYTGDGYLWHYPTYSGDFHSWYDAIHCFSGSLTVNGLTFAQPATGFIYDSQGNETFENLNLIGFRFNNDGLQAHQSNITIKDCFFFSNEDEMVLTTCSNLLIRDCIHWNLQGSIIALGFTPNSQSNFVIRNLTVLHDKSAFVENNGGLISALLEGATGTSATYANISLDTVHYETSTLKVIDIRAYRNGINYAVYQAPWTFTNITVNHIWLANTTYGNPMFFTYNKDPCDLPSAYTITNVLLNGSAAPLSDRGFWMTTKAGCPVPPARGGFETCCGVAIVP